LPFSVDVLTIETCSAIDPCRLCYLIFSFNWLITKLSAP